MFEQVSTTVPEKVDLSFDLSIRLELDKEKANNFPILETFDPSKEFAFTKKNRRNYPEGIKEFRDKLQRQLHAWASCRVLLETQIKSNPDTDKEKLLSIITLFANNYGFSDTQISRAKSVLEQFSKEREKAKKALRNHPQNYDLVNYLTGLNFTEDTNDEFEVKLGPMSLDIVTNDQNARTIYWRNQKKGSKIGSYNNFSAFAAESKNKLILFTVVKDNVPDRESTFEHEHQHQTNKITFKREEKLRKNKKARNALFKAAYIEFKEWMLEKFVYVVGFKDETLGIKNKEAEAMYLRAERDLQLVRAKDEIFSLIRNHKDDWNFKLGTYFSENDTYVALDYLKKVRESDDLDKELIKRIIVNEYIKIIRSSIRALCSFEVSHGLEYAISRLSFEPLQRWPRIVAQEIKTKYKKRVQSNI